VKQCVYKTIIQVFRTVINSHSYALINLIYVSSSASEVLLSQLQGHQFPVSNQTLLHALKAFVFAFILLGVYNVLRGRKGVAKFA
jgi:hypothetical protein